MSARTVLQLIAVDVIGVLLAVFGGVLLYLDFKDGLPSTVGACVGGALMFGGGLLIAPARVTSVVQQIKANAPTVNFGRREGDV